jgi:hypothetical protein
MLLHIRRLLLQLGDLVHDGGDATEVNNSLISFQQYLTAYFNLIFSIASY